jgi:hypothetical protein
LTGEQFEERVKDGTRVRLYSRPGNDLTWRFPLIVEALARLRSRVVALFRARSIMRVAMISRSGLIDCEYMECRAGFLNIGTIPIGSIVLAARRRSRRVEQ